MILKYLPYLLTGGILVSIVSYWMVTQAELKQLKAEKLALGVSLNTCRAAALNIAEDKESDATIDNLPAGDLSSVPDRWLRGASSPE